MKPALYYAITRNPYGYDWFVVAVTTEKDKHWWGRQADGYGATHGKRTGLRGRFETAAQAESVLDDIRAVEDQRRSEMRRIDQESARINQELDERIHQLCAEATRQL